MSGASTKCGAKLLEGDLISGIADITNNYTHMASVIQDPGHADEKSKPVCFNLYLVDHITEYIGFH